MGNASGGEVVQLAGLAGGLGDRALGEIGGGGGITCGGLLLGEGGEFGLGGLQRFGSGGGSLPEIAYLRIGFGEFPAERNGVAVLEGFHFLAGTQVVNPAKGRVDGRQLCAKPGQCGG